MTAWGPPDHHDLHEQPPRVLLVDDAPINLQLLASALGRGYELHVARDGAAALDCIRREPDLDLVLLDIHMPGLDGFEVLTWLREEFPERRLPVIFVTAAGDEQAGRVHGQIERLVQALPAAQRGQRLVFDYVPDAGMKVLVDDRPLVQLAGVEFNRSVLAVWLGATAPADFRAALVARLGQR